MSQSVTPFQFHAHAVRVITRDGEPWFVATDVAAALGYRGAANAARCLADHQRGTHNLSTPGGNQTVTLINEPGLYRLVLRSRKSEAVAFSDWVTGEVLPTIRKTGSYGAPRANAYALAAEAGAAVSRAVFDAATRDTAPNGYARYLLTLGPGQPNVHRIEPDQSVLSVAQFGQALLHGDVGASDDDLRALIHCAATALAQRTHWLRSRCEEAKA